MRRKLTEIAVIAAFVVGSSATALADEKQIKDELKKIEGKWQIVATEANGAALPKKGDDKAILTFTDSKMTGFGPEMTFTIAPDQKPKHITLVAKLKDREITVNSIYELDGDELKIVIPLVEKGKGPENKRPDNFETKDKPVMLLKLKRAK
jgi:uncharacterized protein (TIGR03067 family)